MKKTLLSIMLLAITLSGCGQNAPTQQTQPPAAENPPVEDAAAGRAERTNLEIAVEGVTEEVPAALYRGNGYSIYIPEDGWRLVERETDDGAQETTWESTVNDDVELYVLRYGAYPDATADTTKSHFVRESDYVFEDLMGGALGDPLTGMDEDGDYLGFMTAQGQDGVTFVVAWEYPKGTEEGFGARLPQIANTFAVTK